MKLDTNTFPQFTLTPAACRDFAGDRTGAVIGAYAADRLLKDLNATVRFTFRRHDGKQWHDMQGCVVLGLENDENERGAYNLRANDFGGDPIFGEGSHQVASCAVMGERFGTLRHLNPMLLACAIQSYVASWEKRLGANAFLVP